jgi:hypothetical protein
MPRPFVVLALAAPACLLVGCNGGVAGSVFAQSSFDHKSEWHIRD